MKGSQLELVYQHFVDAFEDFILSIAVSLHGLPE